MRTKLLNFLFAIKSSSEFLHCSNISKFVVISIGLAKPGTILPVVREMTRIEKGNNSIKKGNNLYKKV